MKWEKKIELHNLGTDVSKREEFNQFVVENISIFDAQAWEVFLDLIYISEYELQKHRDFFEKVHINIKEISKNNSLNMRARYRASLITSIIEHF